MRLVEFNRILSCDEVIVLSAIIVTYSCDRQLESLVAVSYDLLVLFGCLEIELKGLSIFMS